MKINFKKKILIVYKLLYVMQLIFSISLEVTLEKKYNYEIMEKLHICEFCECINTPIIVMTNFSSEVITKILLCLFGKVVWLRSKFFVTARSATKHPSSLRRRQHRALYQIVPRLPLKGNQRLFFFPWNLAFWKVIFWMC